MSDEIVNSIWARRLAWSRAADRLGKGISRGRSIALVLSCAGAIFETMAATVLRDISNMRVLSAASGAVCLAISTFVAARSVSAEALRAWTITRSVSEALKAEVFLCRAQGGRYADGDRFAQLNRAVHAIEDGAAELEAELTASPSGGPAAPGELDEHRYIAERVLGQAGDYFRPAAVRYARRTRTLRAAVMVCGSLAAIFGALAAAIPVPAESNLDLAAWVAVVTTIGGAVTADISARRYDFLILTFLTTARRLESLASEWRNKPSPGASTDWASFVQCCEDLIGAANQSWVAKLAQSEKA